MVATDNWTDADIARFDAVVADVRSERARQRGRYTKTHDDEHTYLEWLALLFEIIGSVAMYRRISRIYRIALIQLAATAIAAMEALDRKATP